MDEERKPDQSDKIDTLREDLYSRGESQHAHDELHGRKFSRKAYDVKDDWQTELIGSPEAIAKTYMNSSVSKKLTPLKTLVFFSVLFFLFALGVAGYVFYSGSNTVSTDNVNISAIVPVSVSGGEEVPITISIENHNNVDLESVELTAQFPDGTKKAGDISADLKRYQETVGVVAKNATVSRAVQAVFFGEENTSKEVLISIEYRVKDSNARLYKEKKYELLLKSSPVSVSVDALREVQSGQDVDFTVNLVSNSNTPIENMLLKVEYPFGFEFKKGTPNPTFGKNIWVIPVMNPADKRVIRIKGRVDGQNEEKRVFKFYTGVQDKNNEKNIATNFLTIDHSIKVKRPFVGLEVAFDGNKIEEYSARPGATIRADVLWANNLPTRVADAVIEVQLSGTLFDPLSVRAENGFYRSSDNVIIWDQTSDDTLKILEPSDNGAESFTLPLMPSSYILSQGIRNPEMKFSATVKGRRVSETSVPEEINALITRKVKISTEVGFGAKSTFSLGAIGNHGPIPPKVDQETTYTVIWTVTNTSSRVTDGQVKAFLPSYVKWVGVVSPSTEKVDFQQVGGQITWDVGDIDPYTGFSTTPREVAFQVAITPSLSQLGRPVQLVKDSVFTGTDEFTGTDFKITRSELNTLVTSDPGYTEFMGLVAQ
jgi:hypothetical protein